MQFSLCAAISRNTTLSDVASFVLFSALEVATSHHFVLFVLLLDFVDPVVSLSDFGIIVFILHPRTIKSC